MMRRETPPTRRFSYTFTVCANRTGSNGAHLFDSTLKPYVDSLCGISRGRLVAAACEPHAQHTPHTKHTRRMHAQSFNFPESKLQPTSCYRASSANPPSRTTCLVRGASAPPTHPVRPEYPYSHRAYQSKSVWRPLRLKRWRPPASRRAVRMAVAGCRVW